MSGGDWKELFHAACEGDLALVQYHARAGVDLNYAHPEFLSTPLVAAILARQPAVALWLLDHGAVADLPSEFDACTPVQAARRAGLPEVEDKLCALGVPRPAADFGLAPAGAGRHPSWAARLAAWARAITTRS